ncbi:type III-B CRISPR module RAMP protein Cmr6 [Deinococcus piscis]|uniref:Type III-B CRISPR module RAMP protein Cmr6 n=1 Tax=Deinococcus piscis TaxID=394230 RepID=A0ABQ3KA81_9DEIO|nr:type III-B CRISPR module RAMP protein Cmr6 [Deinococcus piscis]GHG09770.1 type III-B CRISPR module RAMP protein Cmr6 [Deinococcus piscis]
MRTDLRSFPLAEATHAGHALARLTPPKKSGQEVELLSRLKDIVNIKASSDYLAAFQRFQGAAAALEATHFEATTLGPLAIGLGNASAYEVGLTLHHTYGVPYLPASALKGLALRAALKNGMAQEDLDELFGSVGQAGAVHFLDGWLKPEQGQTLQLDTITVHHPDYYASGKEWPTDFDDPNPVTFLSVRPGLTFEVAMLGRSDWANLAADLLRWGLTHPGLGGKTNAGYGGFECSKAEQMLAPEKLAERERLKAFAGRMQIYRKAVESLNLIKTKAELPRFLGQWADLPAELRRELLEQLLERLQNDARTKNDKDLRKLMCKALEEVKA